MTRRFSLILLLMLVWGSEWLLNDQLRDLPRLGILALRCVVAAVSLLPFAFQQDHRKQPVSIARNCVLGLGIIAAPALFSHLATNISAGLEVLVFALIPLVATLFENRGGIAGAPYLLGGILGIAFLVRGALSFSSTQGLSIAWVAICVLIVAFYMVKARQWLPQQNLPGALAVQMLAAAVALGLCSLMRERASYPWTLTLLQVGEIALLGFAGSALAYAILYRLLRYYRPGQITVVQWLIPVVGVAESAAIFGRLPAWDSCAGAVLALLCAVLVLRVDPGATEDTADNLLSIDA